MDKNREAIEQLIVAVEQLSTILSTTDSYRSLQHSNTDPELTRRLRSVETKAIALLTTGNSEDLRSLTTATKVLISNPSFNTIGVTSIRIPIESRGLFQQHNTFFSVIIDVYEALSRPIQQL